MVGKRNEFIDLLLSFLWYFYDISYVNDVSFLVLLNFEYSYVAGNNYRDSSERYSLPYLERVARLGCCGEHVI
jgi:hypothetical protein